MRNSDERDESTPDELFVFRNAEGRAQGIALGWEPPSRPDEGEPLQQLFWAAFCFDFYPGVRNRFPECLPRLASLVVVELAALGSRFSAFNLGIVFEGERVCVAASLHPEHGYVGVDVELESCLEFERLGSIDSVPVGLHRAPTKSAVREPRGVAERRGR